MAEMGEIFKKFVASGIDVVFADVGSNLVRAWAQRFNLVLIDFLLGFVRSASCIAGSQAHLRIRAAASKLWFARVCRNRLHSLAR